MRKFLVCGACAAALASVGCGSTTSFVKSDTTLGRVVVYRNGVAYFERTATVEGDSLKLNVPDDKVDDFLKSLTVVDAVTGEPAPISYPSRSTNGTIDMKVGIAHSAPGATRKLRLSYVTEAPSWKPSYRVVVDKSGKVDLQGWAIVDNTSGEDWKDVKLGVGASSAMSFRFDLKGLRVVQRETLHEDNLFALAPPTGGASYGGGRNAPPRVVAEVTDDVLASTEAEERRKGADPQMQAGYYARNPAGGGKAPTTQRQPTTAAGPLAAGNNRTADPMQQMAQALRGAQNTIVVEGYAAATDKDKMNASLDRANRVREQLLRNGVDPSRVVAVGKGEKEGKNGGAAVFEAPPKPVDATTKKADTGAAGAAVADGYRDHDESETPAKDPAKESTDPIGTSHFESTAAMTVPRGTSAMVSILRSKTDGEVVYLYDPESPRGNTQFPFRTVRFKNPTDSALESGPVSVFGEGRFIGEGLAEPIPAKSVAFVPFALDRQIVVERKDADHDDIAKIITVQRGVFSTEIKHTKKATFTLYNRMPEKAVVYIRHTIEQGYKLTKAPPAESTGDAKSDDREHLGGAHLFRIELEPNGKTDVTIEEATPVFRTTDIRTPAGMDLVRAYLSHEALDGPIKAQVSKLLDLHVEMAKIEQQIATTHEQMGEYRQRMDELHVQLVTLKAVRTAGPLMGHLEKKLQEVSDKLSKATVDVVSLEEKHMVARVQFQSGVGDLSLESKDEKTATK